MPLRGKQKYQVTKLAQRAKLSRLFNFFLQQYYTTNYRSDNYLQQ